MTDDEAIFRAHLGVALRASCSDEVVERSEKHATTAVASEVRDLAAQLEQLSPGLGLMMRLRARLFDAVACAARPRRFRQVVTVGRGLQDAGGRHGCGIRTLAVEHPAVLGAARASAATPGVHYLPVRDFEQAAWDALARSPFPPSRHRTFFLVEGLSLWGSGEALAYWLRAFRHAAAPGSEMLLNLLDERGATHARSTAQLVGERSRRACLGIQFGAPDGTLPSQIARSGLDVVETFDSHALQNACFGVTDLIIRELYVWVRVPGDPCTVPVPPLRSLFAPHLRSADAVMRRSDRPRLRRDVDVDCGSDGQTTLVIRVSALRSCAVSVSRRELAIATLFDGRYSIARIGALFAACGHTHVAREAAALAQRLRARGFLAYDRDADRGSTAVARTVERRCVAPARLRWRQSIARVGSHLAVLREVAFAALEQNDRLLARRVARLLATGGANSAVEHLRTLVQRGPEMVLVRTGRVAVVACAPSTAADARRVVTTATEAVRAIANLLNVRFAGHIVVDVATRRAGLPVTMVADAEPYTVVRIPLPSYSRPMLYHELTHVLAMSGSRWLSEGLAVWVQRRIAPGACFPDDRPVDEGAAVPRSVAEMLLVDPTASLTLDRATYRQAAAFVEWLIARHGLAAFARLFVACRGGGAAAEVGTACRALGFRSLAHIDEQWRRCA